MPRFIALVAGALASVFLFAWPALGASWARCSTNVHAPKNAWCVDLTTGDLDSDLLYIADCASVTVLYEPDTAGAGATTTVQIRNCVTDTVSANCCMVIDNVTLDGTHPNDALYDVRGWAIYVDGTTNPGGGETPRVLVRCEDPLRQ